MSDTPRTDAETISSGVNTMSYLDENGHTRTTRHVVIADFSRTLERENRELLSALQQVVILAGADTASVRDRLNKAASIARAALAKVQP